MATKRVGAMGDVSMDAGVFTSRVNAQITASTAPSVGTQLCYVMNDGGADEGIYSSFAIPKEYVGAPVFVARGILDGTPGASDVLGIGLRKRAVANNEAADATFDAEQIANLTIGSSGTNHADEDEIEITITLTAGDYSADDTVFYYFFIDSSVTTYAGNLLLTRTDFQFSDA